MTLGDPGGIGPDVILLSWRLRRELSLPPFFCVGSPEVLRSRADELGIANEIFVNEISAAAEATEAFLDVLPVIGAGDGLYAAAGTPSSDHAAAIVAWIEAAAAFAISGQASGVVTGPIAKDVLLRSGFAHPGHTEFLAELSRRHGFPDVHPVMLMASPRLMTVPVTVHIPLADVPSRLTRYSIIRTAETTAAALENYFDVRNPRLGFCGLNPHAGENGELGREEIDLIAPALFELRSRGVDARGPFPADTLFHEAARREYDAVLAMYHDQALIPFKTLSFEDGVNVTLGLPFIRTSPDHGTAFSLSGTGKANPSSFIEALRLAARMSNKAARPR